MWRHTHPIDYLRAQGLQFLDSFSKLDRQIEQKFVPRSQVAMNVGVNKLFRHSWLKIAYRNARYTVGGLVSSLALGRIHQRL